MKKLLLIILFLLFFIQSCDSEKIKKDHYDFVLKPIEENINLHIYGFIPYIANLDKQKIKNTLDYIYDNNVTDKKHYEVDVFLWDRQKDIGNTSFTIGKMEYREDEGIKKYTVCTHSKDFKKPSEYNYKIHDYYLETSSKINAEHPTNSKKDLDVIRNLDDIVEKITMKKFKLSKKQLDAIFFDTTGYK